MAKRILAVDDDPGVLKLVRHVLTEGGYEVVESLSAKHALDLLEESQVDLVITDIIMPEMEGIEFIAAVKKKMPRLPVIAMSGGGRSDNTDVLYLARRLGADNILPKPFYRNELLSIVASILEPA